VDDRTYRRIGGLPYRAAYCTALWLTSGYYILQRNGSVYHSFAYGQQARTYTFPSPAIALWGSIGVATYILTLHGEQYICTSEGPKPAPERWDPHYYLEYNPASGGIVTRHYSIT
jgi:hypothetical protein